MTHFEKTLKQYIDAQIDGMDHAISWTAEKDWDFGKKYRYARRCIDEDERDALGAIAYAEIYAEIIDEKTARELRDYVSDAAWKHIHDLDEALR